MGFLDFVLTSDKLSFCLFVITIQAISYTWRHRPSIVQSGDLLSSLVYNTTSGESRFMAQIHSVAQNDSGGPKLTDNDLQTSQTMLGGQSEFSVEALSRWYIRSGVGV